MKTRAVLTPMLCACLAGLLAHAVQQPATAQSPQGFDLRRLTRLDDSKLSSTDAAQLYLAFLQEEIAAPSPPRRGLGGGAITHEYIVAQIVLAGMHAKPEEAVLRRAAATARPGEYRDAIMLTLGLLGDREVVPFLIGYLAKPSNPPWLRERAARALAESLDPAAIPALAAALSDPFWVRDRPPGGQPSKYYPVRSMARLTLRRMKEAAIPLPADVQRALDTAVIDEPLPPSPPPPGAPG